MNQTSIPQSIEFILRLVGIWPGVSNLSAFLFISTSFIFSLTFQFWDAIRVSKDVIILMSSMCGTIAEIMFFMKFLTLRKKRWYVINTLACMINECKKINTEREENIILETLKQSRTFFICTSCIYLSSGTFFTTTAAVTYNTENKEFIFESTFPFEARQSPVYEIIFVIHFFTMIFATLGNAFVDALFIMMVLHASAKIEMVHYETTRFLKIATINEDKTLLKLATKKLIDKYQEAIEFTQKIEYIFSYQLLVQVALSTFELCAAGFVFITLAQDNILEHVGVIKVMKFMVILFASLWITGVYCFGGDFLRNKNELIQQDIYSNLWYELQPTECKTLWILMIRSQRPMKLTAGKMMDLTIYSFSNILKSSASYLSVLRAMR